MEKQMIMKICIFHSKHVKLCKRKKNNKMSLNVRLIIPSDIVLGVTVLQRSTLVTLLSTVGNGSSGSGPGYNVPSFND